MKRSFAATAASALVISLLGAPLALAQQDQTHGGPPAPTHNTPAPSHAMGPSQHAPEHVAPNNMMSQSQHAPEQTQHMDMQHGPAPEQHMAMAPTHQWHHGDRFTDQRRVVTNWQYYHASPPPAGYEWVQDGNQLVLISVASGIIADVLANVYQ
jgi:Ni/Co efflux regulator RcnB